MKHLKLVISVTLAVALGAACTMKESEAPALSGPSEFGKSVNITLVPDAIVQDGASQSVATVSVFGPNGEPLANQSLRTEIRVNNVLTEFGSVSARNLMTGGDGRATFVYTAPPTPAGASISQTTVQIGVTPLGTDAASSTTRYASLRLLPPARGGTPTDLVVTFGEGSPTSGTVGAPLAFAVVPPAGETIVRYKWNFGDATDVTTTGPSASHTYSQAGTFGVTVVAENSFGRMGAATRSVFIADAAAPTADFTVSPTDPTPGQAVRFNASGSQPAAGRTIVSYQWDFRNGQSSSGVTAQTIYSADGTYTVTLTVTDDLGRRGSAVKSVVVKTPTLR